VGQVERGKLVNRTRPMARLLKHVLHYKGKVCLGLACMCCFAMVSALQPFGVVTTAKTLQGKYKEEGRSEVKGIEGSGVVGPKAEEKGKLGKLDVIRSFARSVLRIKRWHYIHLGIVICVIFFLRAVFAFVQQYVMGWVGKRVVLDLRDQLYRHFHRLSISFFSGARTGELISRVTNDMYVVEQAISQGITDIFLQPLTIVFMMGVVVILSWKLAIVTFVAFPLIFIPILNLGRRIRRRTGKIQSLLADLTAIVQETFAGIRVVRAFGMEKYETDKFEKENRKVFSTSVRVVRALSLIRPVVEFLGGASVAAVMIIGAGAFDMELEFILGFCTGVFLLYDPVKKLGQVNSRLEMGAAAAERVFSVLDMQPEIVESPGAFELPRMRKGICYEGVSFRYDDELVLRDVSFDINRGQVVAIVGPSGSGKTTIVNLLLRFYDPTKGLIRIDDREIRGAKISSLRGQVGIVSQEVILFNDTITANIAYGRPDTPVEEVIEAAKAANAHGFISALPRGYDTVVGERGIKLSGGERQRIAIARAILKDPCILILDEATSALDTESERLVQGAINRLMAGRTVLVIAHRLSTVMSADAIIVLDKGRVVQKGSHQKLIEQGGLYKKLYDLQFKVV
jgi:subfamily B ATP-binding cassette protein MsbA